MACMEHYCTSCNEHWMDNKKVTECPNNYCKGLSVTNWFDEPESDSGDDYDDILDD